MGRRVLQLPIDDAIVGRGDHLHVLQRAREPIDARLGKHDPERRMTIEHAAEDQLADDLTERHEALQQEGSCAAKIGNAWCRERVGQYVWISGVAVTLKKKRMSRR